MEQIVRFSYEDGCDLINCLESLERILPKYGVKFEVLEGGDGYEEVSISKVEE